MRHYTTGRIEQNRKGERRRKNIKISSLTPLLGTEPKVRFYVEARTEAGKDALFVAAKSMLKEIGLLEEQKVDRRIQ